MTISILVTGATGKQGGGVVNGLLTEDSTTDVEILAVTRKPDSASAQKLAQKSPKIKLVKGDLDDPNALLDTAKEVSSTGAVWGVFSVQVSSPVVSVSFFSFSFSFCHHIWCLLDCFPQASIITPTDLGMLWLCYNYAMSPSPSKLANK